MSGVLLPGAGLVIPGGGGVSLPTDDVGAVLGGATPSRIVGTDGSGDGALLTGAQVRTLAAPALSLGTAFDAGTSTSAYLDVTGTPSAAPTLAPGQSLVMLIYPIATPSASEVLACHANAAGTRGWHLYSGFEAGDRSALSLFLSGLTGTGALGTIPLAAATWSGALNTPHVVAVAVQNDGSIRYSWDGGSVQTIAAPSGTYVPPSSGDPFRVGAWAGGGPASASAQPVALRCYSTVLSNADLVAVAATRASLTLSDPSSGTLSASVAASQWWGAIAAGATVIDAAESSRRWRLVGALVGHAR